MAAPLRFELPRSFQGRRLDHVLDELVPDHSRAALQKLVRRGRVKLDGRRVLRSNVRLGGGEVLSLELEAAPPPTPRVVHEEADFAVFDKPAGLLTHPTPTRREPSVSSFAVERYGPLPSVEEGERPGIVHRLDRATSGLILLARTPEALDHLRELFRARRVEKTYLAFVDGIPRQARFEVERPLGPQPSHPDRQRVTDSGKAASTAFHVEARGRGVARVRCHPRTGRRHQLRVHLAHAGTPILGDELYARATSVPAPPRLALHACALRFEDRQGKSRTFELPLAEDLDTWARGLALRDADA